MSQRKRRREESESLGRALESEGEGARSRRQLDGAACNCECKVPDRLNHNVKKNRGPCFFTRLSHQLPSLRSCRPTLPSRLMCGYRPVPRRQARHRGVFRCHPPTGPEQKHARICERTRRMFAESWGEYSSCAAYTALMVCRAREKRPLHPAAFLPLDLCFPTDCLRAVPD